MNKIYHSKIVGIMNLTPDSFSDGGVISSMVEAKARARTLIREGADVLDVGAESTRPGAVPLGPNEEWARLEEPLRAIFTLPNLVPVSIDTRHPETARKAIELGASWINDVSGAVNPAMLEVAAKTGVHLVAMHSLSIPASPDQVVPQADVVNTISQWTKTTIERLVAARIDRARIIIDPGIGFGKTAEQSMSLLKNIMSISKLGIRTMVGHSRKSFLTQVTNRPPQKRDPETHLVSAFLNRRLVDYLRVHDVAGTHSALTLAAKLES